MTNQEIAEKLVEYCRTGNYQECYQELYAPDAVSIEPDGKTAKGLEEFAKKGEEWNERIVEFKGSYTGDPIVAGNYFSLAMGITAIFNDSPEVVDFKEICVYEIKDGKIVKEQFFYD